MRLSRRADVTSYEDFVTRRYPALVRFGALLAGDPRHGEDLAQEGLIAAFGAWGRLEGPDGRPEAYVRKVMVRTASRARRRRWTDEVPTADLPDGPVGDFAAGIDVSTQVFAALRLLPWDQRAVLVLRFWADASEAEIAATLGVPVGTVKSRLSRALATLRTTDLFHDVYEELS